MEQLAVDVACVSVWESVILAAWKNNENTMSAMRKVFALLHWNHINIIIRKLGY